MVRETGTRDMESPGSLVAVAKAAHAIGDRDLERAAKKLLREKHGIEIRFRCGGRKGVSGHA